MSGPEQETRWDVDLRTFDASAAAGSLGARRWALEQVPDWPHTSRERLESVVGELVANAFEHGAPPVTLLMELCGADRHVRLTVRDGGAGAGQGAGHRGASTTPPAHERGRGLALVQALCDLVDARTDERGHRVTVELGP